MSLPYENTTSGKNAINEIEKTLGRFGCKKFGYWTDYEEATLNIQFEHKGRTVQVTASASGYAAAYLKEHPYSSRMRCTKQQHEKKALDKGMLAVYSVLRDWIKGQVTAIETGILSFEGAFLGQILLPSGKTVLEHARSQDVLPPPEDEA